MATEATVLHGPLPSAADGSTTSPTPRGGDGKLDDRPLSHTAVSRRSERRERMRDEAEKDKEAYSSDDASVRSSRRRQPSRTSSFPYRDIIKSVLSNIMTKNEEPTSSSPSSSRPSSSQGKDKSDIKDKKVEDVVRGLAMEEWNARWLDELVAKVKGEREFFSSFIFFLRICQLNNIKQSAMPLHITASQTAATRHHPSPATPMMTPPSKT